MPVIYRYARFHSPGEEEYATIEEALDRAAYDIEYNEAYPKEIVAGDGTVFDHDRIFEHWKKLYS